MSLRRAVPVVLTGLVAGLVAATSGCGASSEDDVDTYVAMGDSFTSAPGVPTTDTTSGCLRSDGNYPALLSRELDVELVDVSCGSADTTAVTGSQPATGGAKPPQLDAVDESTDLVTLGIGINDFALYSSLLFNCTALAANDPAGSPCRDAMSTPDGDRLSRTIDQIGPLVEAALVAIADRAPDARVVLVGYPQFVPPTGTCPELPLASGDYPYVRELTEQLGRTLEQAADDAGADYLDLVSASRGHDICAGPDAWVNGSQDDPERAVLFHPFPEEQAAVAELIAARL